jgi:hypothetical protein
MSHRDFLMVDLGFGEQDVPLMAFLRHLMLLLFADAFLFLTFLRFKPFAKLGIKTEVS